MCAQKGIAKTHMSPEVRRKGPAIRQRTPDLRNIRFTSVQSVASGLRKQKITPNDYAALISKAMRLGPRKARMVFKGLLRATPNLQDRLQILTSIQSTQDRKLRREIVHAYRASGADMEFITGLSLMTVQDGMSFFRPYLKAGGTTKDVAKWLYGISAQYQHEKRKERFNPKYSGWWSDTWDSVMDEVENIGEAINKVIDEMLEAGITFGEIVSDIAKYPQRRINTIVEALLDAGRDISEFITGAIEAGKPSIIRKVFKALFAAGVKTGELLKVLFEEAAGKPSIIRKAFQALLAVGVTTGELLKALFEEAIDFVRDGIKLLIDIGVRIRDILKEALDLSRDILKDVVGFLVDLGHSVWYIMKFAVKKTFAVVKDVVERLIELGTTIGEIILWFGRRSLSLVKQGFEVLFSLGYTLGVILHTMITDPRHLIERGFKALRELGKTVYDFFSAVKEFGVEALERVYQTLASIGVSLVDMLVFAVSQHVLIYKEIVLWLVKAGAKILEILLWAVERSYQVFSWTMEVVDTTVDTFLDIIEWAAKLGGPVIERLAKWLADHGREALDWFETKVLEPLLEAGKLYYVFLLASATIVFLAIAFVLLKKHIVDPDATDYKHWPSTLRRFKTLMGSKLIDLPDVDANHKYVLISDLHMDSKDDVDGGIGHFYKNADIVAKLIDHYSGDPTWTILSVGDEQEFWYSSDLAYISSKDKVDQIAETYHDLFDNLSTKFYKNMSPRRYIKMRGNHDDLYSDPEAVSRFRDHGFPEINVYDYATIRWKGRPILIMHGMQFDVYNCDANNDFGKFSSNFVGESLVKLNETIVEIFGEDARIVERSPFGKLWYPFLKKSDWKKKIDSMEQPCLSCDLDFTEQPVAAQIRKYDCSIILGHTHGPKLMKDPEDQDRFYGNLGTSGWWEGCVWTMEICEDDIVLNAWTADKYPEPFRPFKLSNAPAILECCE